MMLETFMRRAKTFSPSLGWFVVACLLVLWAAAGAVGGFVLMRITPNTELLTWGALLAPSGWMMAAIIWWALEAASLIYGRPLHAHRVVRGVVSRFPLVIVGIAVLFSLSMIASADVSTFVREASGALWVRVMFAACLYASGVFAWGLVLHYPALRRLKRAHRAALTLPAEGGAK